MKVEINEMLSEIAIKAVLIFLIVASVLSFPAKAYAAGNSSSDPDKVYDNYFVSWTNGSGQYEINYEIEEFDGVTYYIPVYRDESKKKLLYSQYYVNSVSGYVNDEKIESLLVRPALIHTTSIDQYIGSYCYPSVLSTYEGYANSRPDNYYTDVNIFGPSCPVFNCFLSGDILADYLYYISTGSIPPGMDRDMITLPDGWTIDEDGVPRENSNDLILEWVGYSSNKPSYKRQIYSGFDDRKCFFLNGSDNIFYVYDNNSLDDLDNSGGSHGGGHFGSNDNLGSINLDISNREKLTFLDVANKYFNGIYIQSSDQTVNLPSLSNCIFTSLLNDNDNFVYSITNTVCGYPIIIKGSNLRSYVHLNSEDSYVTEVKRVASAIYGKEFVFTLFTRGTGDDSIYCSSLKVTRPVFYKRQVASNWYDSEKVSSINEIYFIPQGYYYHSDTRILDKNPLSDSDQDSIDGIPASGGSHDINIDNSINDSNNNNSVNITSGQGVTVIVTQENNNNQTNDNNQNVTVPAGGGNIQDGFPLNDIGDGLNYITNLTKSIKGGSSDSGGMSTGGTPDSGGTSTGGALDAGTWTDLLGGMFNFLPVEFTSLLLIGLIAAVLLRFLGR